MADAQPTSVYRYYDEHDLLLYVGITSRGSTRITEHNKSKDWWKYVTRQDVDHYPTRDAALTAERVLIQTFKPPFNTQHNSDWRAMRRAYEELAATGGLRKLSDTSYLPSLPRQFELVLIESRVLRGGERTEDHFIPGPEFAPIRRYYSPPVGSQTSVRIPVSGGHKAWARIHGDRLLFIVRHRNLPAARKASVHIKVVNPKPLQLFAKSINVDRLAIRSAA